MPVIQAVANQRAPGGAPSTSSWTSPFINSMGLPRSGVCPCTRGPRDKSGMNAPQGRTLARVVNAISKCESTVKNVKRQLTNNIPNAPHSQAQASHQIPEGHRIRPIGKARDERRMRCKARVLQKSHLKDSFQVASRCLVFLRIEGMHPSF